jgi:hypothetical protein
LAQKGVSHYDQPVATTTTTTESHNLRSA